MPTGKELFDIGLEYYSKGNWDKARDYYEQAAAKNYLYALTHLGMMYQHGQGVAQDYGKAREYYERMSCFRGGSMCGDAYFNLGVFYEKGLGVAQDYNRARDCYEQAAFGSRYNYQDRSFDPVDGDAYNAIGMLYEKGLGVAQDYNKAREYYEKVASSRNRCADAYFNLGKLYEKGLGVAQDYGRARKNYENANSGLCDHPAAYTALGILHEKGHGVPQDIEKALIFYQRAAARGDRLALQLVNKKSPVLAFFELLEHPDQLTFLKLNEVFSLVKHVTEFKFPYTLASIARETNSYPQSEINQLIFDTLTKLADNHINSEEEAVAFKLILESAFHKKTLTKTQMLLLDRKAEKTDTFADKRFVDLKTRVASLENQVAYLNEVSYQHSNHIQQIASSVTHLKETMKKRAKRQMYYSVAKMALCFAGPLVDILSNVADLSDIAEVSSVLLGVDVSTLQSTAKTFTEHVDTEKLKEEFINHSVEKTLEKIGLSPDKYIEIWTKTTLTLNSDETLVKKELQGLKSPLVQQSQTLSSAGFFLGVGQTVQPGNVNELGKLANAQPASFFSGATSESTSLSIEASSELKTYIEKLAKSGYIFTISQQPNLRQIDIECIKMNMQDPELDDHPQCFMQLLQNNMKQAGIAHVEMQHIQEEDKLVIQGARGAIKSVKELLESVAIHHLAVTSKGSQCILL